MADKARSNRALSSSTRLTPYETLKNAILNGPLEPGQPLVESTLAAMCQVSRTPIREALRRLEQDGLVHHSEHGLVVRERSPAEILDIYDTRIVLEAMAGRTAADRRTTHDIRMLRQMIVRSRQINESAVDAMVAANQQFHRMVWRAARNEALIDLLERINLHLVRYPGTTLAVRGRWQSAQRQHEFLVDAIENRDGDAAYAHAEEHFSDARDIRLELFAEEQLDELAPPLTAE